VFDERTKKEYYQALVDKDTNYEGVFFVGIKTTGVFCRPSCPSRKPKYEHCEFFKTAEEALLASYRPCKRCRPLSNPHEVSSLVQHLVNAVEENPEKRWKNRDFEELSVHAPTARRQFRKRFGMTFVEYARARRMGIAMKQMRSGKPVIQAQLSTGYESGSGFRDAFNKIMGTPPSKKGRYTILKASWIDTPLGPMMAIADEEKLYLLEFVDRRGLEREVERLRKKINAVIIPGASLPIQSITKELEQYFKGQLQEFKTPLVYMGSPFQQQVWNELVKIPAGETRSYSDLAKLLGRPTAFRAVANANGANQLSIIIPCHRVINSDGNLGGYGGGLSRKKWLLDHEKQTQI
jgi:AraC family transcriptional regulator, regulatory protein of adaptative response / methylated-DNA-[protein]-cysteine methyltransferase